MYRRAVERWAALGVFALTLAAQAEVTNKWIGGDGDFSDPLNWNTGVVPSTPDDYAYFSNATLAVRFTQSMTNYRARVSNTNYSYTWNLDGHEYALLSTANNPTQAALCVDSVLTVSNGFLHTWGYGVGIYDRGDLILTGPQTRWYDEGAVVTWQRGVVGNKSGGLYRGLLRIESGACVSLYGIVVGYSSGRFGYLEIVGPNTIVTNRSHAYIGNYGSGTVLVKEGGHWDVSQGSLYVGYSGTNLNVLEIQGGTVSASSLLNNAGTNALLSVMLQPGGTNALITLGGDLTLNTGFKLQVELADGFAAKRGERFTLIKVGGTIAGTAGVFENVRAGNAILNEGDLLVFGDTSRPLFQGYTFRVSYTGGAGHDVTLETVDTPNVGTLIMVR